MLETSAAADLSLARFFYEPSSRRFDVTFELGSGRAWRYTGTAVETVEVAVPSRALARGELIKANDIAIEIQSVGLSDAKALELFVEQKSDGSGPVVTYAPTTGSSPVVLRYHIIVSGC